MPCNGVAVSRVKLEGEISDNDILMALNEMGLENVQISMPGAIRFDYGVVVHAASGLSCAGRSQSWLQEVSEKASGYAKQARKRKAIATVKKLGEVVNEEQVRVGLKTGTQLTIRF